MIAINAIYHRAYLTRLYRKAETVGCDLTESDPSTYSQRFTDFTEDNRGSEAPLALIDLTALYNQRLVALGLPYIKRNTTRLREGIQRVIPDI